MSKGDGVCVSLSAATRPNAVQLRSRRQCREKKHRDNTQAATREDDGDVDTRRGRQKENRETREKRKDPAHSTGVFVKENHTRPDAS